MPNARSTFQLLVGLLIANFSNESDEVKCFCDRLSCPGSTTCHGKWCLIGISTEGGNGRIDQTCGWDERDRPLDCAKNWDRWTEVCACDTKLCNTFAYLRLNMDQNTQQASEQFGGENKRYGNSEPGRPRGGWYQGGNLIILLVILPLAVGGLAVCLVFVNYHCKMS